MKSCKGTLIFLFVGIQSTGQEFSLFSSFASFSLIFSAAKHFFEDDNSKDGWLDRFSP